MQAGESAGLGGRVAVVTGAGSGIGRATALALARVGAIVVAGNRDVAAGESLVAEIVAAGGTAMFVPTDVTRSADLERLMQSAVTAHGRLDILFNNAGYQETRTLLGDSDDTLFERVFSTNTRSTWAGMKHALAHMVPRGRGVIVNCASASGLRNANKGLGLYSASKAAVVSLTKSAALEYGPAIRINAVSPGRVETPMMLRSKIADMKVVADGRPLKRLGHPEEVAAAVVWLASDAASFVTGHVLAVDGGFGAT